MGNIGTNIMRFRKQLGITQEELAARMGYKSKSSINKIEMGINDIPQSKIVKFADVLGVTPAAIMGWEEEEKKNDFISDAVVKMRTNDEFMSVVETLYSLDDEKLKDVKLLLTAFLK